MQKERTCLKQRMTFHLKQNVWDIFLNRILLRHDVNAKGENLLEAKDGDDGAGDHYPDGCHEHRVQHLVFKI